jgi:hypothetical protein
MEQGQFAEVAVSVQDILACSYSSWYSKFEDYTLSEAAIFKPLPKEFIDYLESDGIELPKGSQKDSVLFQDATPTSDNEYSDWEQDENAITEQKTMRISNKTDPTSKFEDFHYKLKEAIRKFGSVAPKLNWSAPQDATWIMTGRNMRCFSTSDLFLLLKSSDYLNHDMYHAFDEAKDFDKERAPAFDVELVLRKWVDVNPSTEFRCFVRDRQLIAISQRDLNYYSFLEDIQDDLIERIGVFFDDILMSKFDANSFVFDVYVPKPFNKVYLVDINPFQRTTDSLLFSWNELATMKPDADDINFRSVTEHNSGRFATKAHSQNHVPRDFLDASVDTQAMIDFLKKCKELELNGEASENETE